LGETIPVASAEGVNIHCLEEGKFSFFNSPYPAHRLSTGMDVYPERNFGDVAPSPVHGKVTLVRKVRCPRSSSFIDHGHDIVLLLRSLENPNKVVKILHVEPSVESGDVLEPGQPLGTLIRSGFYGFATHPHIHVEVREPSDAIRARGGHSLCRLTEVTPRKALDELAGTVTKSIPEYSQVIFKGADSLGLTGSINGVPVVLDGGLPYYGWLGAHFEEIPHGDRIELCSVIIAEIREMKGRTCVADCTDFNFRIDGMPIGLSIYLHPRANPEAVIIPHRIGGLKLEEGEEVIINLESPRGNP
jgi:hypothetical protein